MFEAGPNVLLLLDSSLIYTNELLILDSSLIYTNTSLLLDF